jgi:hypothetical protein
MSTKKKYKCNAGDLIAVRLVGKSQGLGQCGKTIENEDGTKSCGAHGLYMCEHKEKEE